MAKTTNKDRLRQAPVASGRLFNEEAEVVNIADLVASITEGVVATISGLEFVDGAATVGDGVIGALHTRVMPAAATTHPGADVAGVNTNARTYTEAQNVRKVFITATPTTPGVTVNELADEFCLILLDAPNGATAKVFLDDVPAGNSTSEEFLYIKIPLGKRVELPASNSPIRRIDGKPSVECHIVSEGM